MEDSIGYSTEILCSEISDFALNIGVYFQYDMQYFDTIGQIWKQFKTNTFQLNLHLRKMLRDIVILQIALWLTA